jgi:CRP-like cAMP-binding protein
MSTAPAGPEPESPSWKPEAEPPSGGPEPESSSWALLGLAGDEARLPPGIRLVDEARPGKQCFVLLEGAATVEAGGDRIRELDPGAFVGLVDSSGRPVPPSGLTVQLTAHSRVLVIDAKRLVMIIDSNPAAAAAWRQIAQQVAGQPGNGFARPL